MWLRSLHEVLALIYYSSLADSLVLFLSVTGRLGEVCDSSDVGVLINSSNCIADDGPQSHARGG